MIIFIALGLSDTENAFFGEEVDAILRGKSVFNTKSAEILLGELRTGVIGQTDVLSPAAIQTVID